MVTHDEMRKNVEGHENKITKQYIFKIKKAKISNFFLGYENECKGILKLRKTCKLFC